MVDDMRYCATGDGCWLMGGVGLTFGRRFFLAALASLCISLRSASRLACAPVGVAMALHVVLVPLLVLVLAQLVRQRQGARRSDGGTCACGVFGAMLLM